MRLHCDSNRLLAVSLHAIAQPERKLRATTCTARPALSKRSNHVDNYTPDRARQVRADRFAADGDTSTLWYQTRHLHQGDSPQH